MVTELIDLFGNQVRSAVIEEKTFEEKYADYIGSAAWKRLREYKIKSVGNKCEKCHISGYTVELQVHHLSYERFKHECLDDLQVLCQKCHVKADQIRQETDEEKRIKKKMNSALVRGFEEWMDNTPGESEWFIKSDNYLKVKWDQFTSYLHLSYKPKYWRSPNWCRTDPRKGI